MAILLGFLTLYTTQTIILQFKNKSSSNRISSMKNNLVMLYKINAWKSIKYIIFISTFRLKAYCSESSKHNR